MKDKRVILQIKDTIKNVLDLKEEEGTLSVRGAFSMERGHSYLIPVEEVERLKRGLEKGVGG